MNAGWRFKREERGKTGIELPYSLILEKDLKKKKVLSGMSRPMGAKEASKKDPKDPNLRR